MNVLIVIHKNKNEFSFKYVSFKVIIFFIKKNK